MYKSKRHPGIVLEFKSYTNKIIAIKGTDIRNIQSKWIKSYTILEPDHQNGLKKTTAFFNIPKEINKIAIELNKYLGIINGQDLNKILKKSGLTGVY